MRYVVHRNTCSQCKNKAIMKRSCGHFRSENVQNGIKFRPKDMRDIFATVVTEHVTNPDTTRRLLRHTNLTTTTRYLRGVKNRMTEAVKFLGASLGGGSGGKFLLKTTQINISGVPAKVSITQQKNWEMFGGGGGTRTLDNADMSRVL